MSSPTKGIGGPDDHLTGRSRGIPFDPRREEGNIQETTKLAELSKAIFSMMHGDIIALSNNGIKGLPQSEEDLRKRLETDPNFIIMKLLIVNMKRDVSGLRGSMSELAQRAEGIGSSVRELNDRTASIKTYGF